MIRRDFFGSVFVFVVSILLLLHFMPALSSAGDIYESRLDKGLKNTEPYSYILIRKAQADPSNAKNLLTEALRYSPDLPVTYFELAKTQFSPSAEGIFGSLEYSIEGFRAYKKNFWWLQSITDLAFLSLMTSFIIALLFVVFISFFKETPLLAHEIAENKKKAVLVLILIPLSFSGPLFFIAGALSLFGLYFRKIDKLIVYLSFLLLLLSQTAVKMTDNLFSSFSPEQRAVIDVNEGRDNKYAISVLKGKNDFVSKFSYGLALKREGRYEEAISVYNSLLPSSDPQICVNLGNCYYGIGNLESAKEAYQKSVELMPLASAYFNLSQLSRETLDFAKGEEYYLEAMKLDRESLSQFKATSEKNPNRFVIDETLPISVLRKYSDAVHQKAFVISILNPTFTIIIALVFFIFFYFLDTLMKDRAYSCKRCGAILCRKCSKELLWGQMCAQCYKSLVKLDSLDPRERVSRLLKVQELQGRTKNISKILSFFIPGIAHIYAGRILTGSLLLWMFLFLAMLAFGNLWLPLAIHPFSHGWITIPAVAFMFLIYLFSNISFRRRLNRGWL